MDFREEGPECETPGIFISMDEDSSLTEAALLDSSLEGPLPKVGVAAGAAQESKPRDGARRGLAGDPPLTRCPLPFPATRRQQRAG